jgi:hypothetical protein
MYKEDKLEFNAAGKIVRFLFCVTLFLTGFLFGMKPTLGEVMNGTALKDAVRSRINDVVFSEYSGGRRVSAFSEISALS